MISGYFSADITLQQWESICSSIHCSCFILTSDASTWPLINSVSFYFSQKYRRKGTYVSTGTDLLRWWFCFSIDLSPCWSVLWSIIPLPPRAFLSNFFQFFLSEANFHRHFLQKTFCFSFILNNFLHRQKTLDSHYWVIVTLSIFGYLVFSNDLHTTWFHFA